MAIQYIVWLSIFFAQKMARLAGFAPKVRICTLKFAQQKMARLAGFEPANDGTKTRCLTTWRQPNPYLFYTFFPR